MILPLTGEYSVTSILRDRPNKKYVQEVKDYTWKLTMHMTGKGLDKAIKKFDYYESSRLLLLRQQYSPSNEDFFARLHRPVDKIFSAKGGSVNYILPDGKKKEFIGKLQDVRYGYSLRKWVETFWMPALFYDPMGIVLMEIEDGTCYPTYKSAECIHEMPKPKGRHFDWLIFNVDKNGNTIYDDVNKSLISNGGYYRVIDDESDRLIKWDGGVATVIEEQSYENYFGKVPAVTIGNQWDAIHDRFASPDDAIIPIADQHLRSRSVLVMFELHHGFPLNWQYASACPTCNGTTKVTGDICPSCNGTGKDSKKDVSKMVLLPFPTSKDQPIIDKPGGSVDAPIDSWQEMKLTIEQQYKEAHYCSWGTHQIEDSSHETATGRFIDVQPVNDRLAKFSDAAEWMEMWITDMMGEFYYGEAYGGSEINLGRRYLIETPDAISNKLQKAIKDKMAYSYLKNMYFQWVDSEYSGDEMMRLKLTMEFKLDPAPFMSIPEAKQAFISERDYQRKLYYGEWLETLPENWYILHKFDTLKTMFDEWVDERIDQQEDEQEEQGDVKQETEMETEDVQTEKD